MHKIARTKSKTEADKSKSDHELAASAKSSGSKLHKHKSRKHKKHHKNEEDDHKNKHTHAFNPQHQFLGITQPREFASTANIRAPDKAYHTKVKHVVHRGATRNDATDGEGGGRTDGEENDPDNPTEAGKPSGHQGDINKLVFVPKPPKVEKLIEKGTGRLVDYIFLIANFGNLLVSMFHILLGLTILSFTSSIQSILDEDSTDPVAILHTTSSSPSTMPLILIIGAIVQILNVFLGVYAAVQGFKNVLVVHAVLSLLFLLIGTGLTIIVNTNTAHCNDKDLELVQTKMLEYIRLYGTEPPKEEEARSYHETAAYQLDSIQIGLSCCGGLGWSDYMNPLTLQDGNSSAPLVLHKDLDEVETVFPSSCCRPWWVRNVHCSKGTHVWAHPSADAQTAFKFRQRINQAGCLRRVKNGCQRILYLVQTGMWASVGIDFALLVIKLLCIYSIETVIWQIIKKKKEFIASDLGHTEVMDDVEQETAEGRIALPTEDEIEIIKARTDFNKFEARVKRTQIGKWLKQARKSVYMDFEKNNRTSQVDIRPKELIKSGAVGQANDQEEQFMDAEQVLKLEIEKQKRIRQERKKRVEKRDTLTGIAPLTRPHGTMQKTPHGGGDQHHQQHHRFHH